MINISKLLKNAPKGIKLYSPLFGEVKFKYVNDSQFGIVVEDSEECSRSFDKYGRYFPIYNNAECLLFPSKDCRTWEGWKLPVQPKFKTGDWLVYKDGSCFAGGLRETQVVKVKDGVYFFSSGSTGSFKFIDENCRLWTVKDAKDGDILAGGSDNPFIYNGNIEFSFAGAYVGVSRDGKIRLDMFPSKCWASVENVKPATKKQRDLLFAKMKEIGYEWDSERKELCKIKSHYDIANFYAGMPVLVRETSLNTWQYVLFSHCYIGSDGLTRFNAGLVGFTQCIPFNKDTEHLLGTTNMPDEYYISW